MIFLIDMPLEPEQINALFYIMLGFSPVIVGLSALFVIKNRQSKKLKPKGTFQESFGL